ncbi:MAG: 1-acyl-sn-glycerol-3-phosphate acyltransferase [Bacteroidales bacterium]|jgi:putative hemolysin|nr:1-acyl-sn-glycerol-3-phosphate acyltransferase [Bacteroidales bacterium]
MSNINENIPLRVDIDGIIKAKSAVLYRWLPRFVVKFLKKIIHQDELNILLERHKDLDAISFVKALIEDEFHIKFEVFGSEKIPTTGRLLIVSNHPLGGFDGLALIELISHFRTDIKFPVNDLLMNVANLRTIFVPINKTGKNSIALAREFDEVFRSQSAILYFPAGICSRKINGKIQDLEWKKTFVSKAKSTQRDILPIYFSGKNTNFFYNFAKLRKNLGIKVNLEMLFLVDEFFKQKNKTYQIYIGDVIPYQSLLNNHNDKQLAQQIREKVYQLKK